MKAGFWSAWIACVVTVWTVAAITHEQPSYANAEAFWAAAAAPSSLYSPLDEHSEEPPTAWCEGQDGPHCAPAAPNAPHQPISFAQSPVAVLPRLDVTRFATGDRWAYWQRLEDAREGVRQRIERPPIA